MILLKTHVLNPAQNKMINGAEVLKGALVCVVVFLSILYGKDKIKGY